jgi:hypothetical protein
MTTWPTSSARIAGFSLAAIAFIATPLQAAQAPTTASYVIQSVVNQSDGSMSATELLTIASSNGSAAVTVTQPSTGAVAHATAPIDANGIVSIVSSDPALACYNNAQGIIANRSLSQSGTGAALAVSFAGTSFAVPLNIGTSAAPNGAQEFTFSGNVEGTFSAMPQTQIAIVIDGSVRTQQHQLASVRLRETTVVAATHAAIGQTTCSMTRVVDAPASVTI